MIEVDIKKRIQMAELLDFYGNLLKDNQFKTINSYYSEDLSLTEIAKLLGISKQGVWDNIKRSQEMLINFENKLHLVEKYKQKQKNIILIKENINNINLDNKQDSLDKIKNINNLVDEILE